MGSAELQITTFVSGYNENVAVMLDDRSRIKDRGDEVINKNCEKNRGSTMFSNFEHLKGALEMRDHTGKLHCCCWRRCFIHCPISF